MSDGRLALFGGPPTLERASHKTWPEITDAERTALARVLDRGVLSGAAAPETVLFEREFAAFVDAKHALLTHSGTSALHLALAAAGVSAGDHVVVPAYSFVATPLAVLHGGAIPIFADVDPRTGALDPTAARAAVTARTRAIMPVHIHGAPADMGALRELARDHGLALIEDAAQAHGATYQGKKVGALGSSGGFSLQSSKNLSAGEGGVFVTNDDAIAERANSIRNFGQDVALAEEPAFDQSRPLDSNRAFDSTRIGFMYRGNEMQAAFARAQLARLPEATENARANAERLSHALSELPGVSPVSILAGTESAHHKFRVRLDPAAAGVDLSPRALRDATLRGLRAEGLEVVLWQVDPLPAQALFRQRIGFGGGFPWSLDHKTDFDALYDATRFPNTQLLLDSSIVLFSQSCPLIAQTAEVVDIYAKAFARVWRERRSLERWAHREAHEEQERRAAHGGQDSP
jgi:perosamine synthetase